VSDRLLQDLLEASVAAYPQRAAVEEGDRRLSYGELDVQSARLASLLREVGVCAGDRVGLYLDKSLEAIVGLYGVLRTGAAYVPLDPQAPPTRLAYIARDCDLRVLVTGAEKAESWPELVNQRAPLETLVLLDGAECAPPAGVALVRSSAVESSPPRVRRAPASADELAYILYTSGSTGAPKGVMLSHRNALAFVDWAVGRFGVRPEDRLSSHAPLHFDLSVFDLYAAAAAGAAVVLVPPLASLFPRELARFIEDRTISIWYSVPTILSALALRGSLEPEALPSLRAVLFAGEVFPTKYLRLLMELLPHARFHNLYGPTETNVCTHYELRSPPGAGAPPIPIGLAIDDVDVFAVTEAGEVAPEGETGELYVAGPTVMQGYWGDPAQTAEVLVPDPRGGADRVYRTGDLVRKAPDGSYRFLGRRDSQVKSRGYRIELGEIESALDAHEAVVECAVVAVPDELVTNRIKAAVVVRQAVEAAELASFCAGRIPRYMIPESFEFRSALPRTSTGKTDRQALLSELG
jgi:L-proline---[L-prolyl-carrier protein] ligase